MAYCPPPGAILPPPIETSDATTFSIPASTFANFTSKADTSFAIKASIGGTQVFQHEYSAPDYEVAQSLHETKMRLGSGSKLFTVLALELSRDKINWDDPITNYLPKLDAAAYGQVTVAALANHMSGLGRFGYTGDLGTVPNFNPALLGMPPVTNTLPNCDPYPGGRVCTRPEVYAMFNHAAYYPRSPCSGPMYSNVAYSLLGMALSAVHGKPFEQLIADLIFTPLSMAKSTYETPPADGSALLPKNDDAWACYAADFGNHNPTGGIWTTPSEMLHFLNSLLTHKLLSPARTRSWMQPRAVLPSLHQLVGAPWEIFRPADFTLAFPRPIDMYTKLGGMPGYTSWSILIPEFDLAVTMHVGGANAQAAIVALMPLVVRPLVAHADALARRQARAKYAGTYRDAQNADNTLTIALDDAEAGCGAPGLRITHFSINGVLVLKALAALQKISPADNLSAGLYPTDPDSLGTGKETFRMLLDRARHGEAQMADFERGSWNWGDPFRYVREPVDGFEFAVEGGVVKSLDLRGWRTVLVKV
ncbi:beta-lactamase/transpeptidase-like protein [Massariosphaeria phaeospora]|uniref:Beta-lactamase/transpeptidase-like protein n=1 Tax=Massariosphaeria phaeospora TaxID=100035 RepID=A0A7C8I1U3_9PLEO|nr:beta-lactamase/transpeptidase-like protein [Massariosphaeria phaeospora]